MADLTKQELYEHVGADTAQAEHIAKPQLSYARDVARRFFSNRIAVLSVAVLALIAIMAVIGPFMTSYDYRTTDVAAVSEKLASEAGRAALGPDAEHWFGVDSLGRDLWARVWMGTRYSLLIGFAAALVQAIIGVLIGCVSGYFGGMVDNIMMRIVEVVNGIPYMIVVVLLMMVLPRGIFTMVVAYATVGWTGMARLVRGQCLSLKNQEFVVAAEAMGAKPARIIRKHLLPNTLSVIIINVTLQVPSAIFTEAFLSYIGMGVPVPQPSWGMLAQEGASVFQLYPWRLWIPAIAISLTMLSFNLLGDGLRDAFDPRLRR